MASSQFQLNPPIPGLQTGLSNWSISVAKSKCLTNFHPASPLTIATTGITVCRFHLLQNSLIFTNTHYLLCITVAGVIQYVAWNCQGTAGDNGGTCKFYNSDGVGEYSNVDICSTRAITNWICFSPNRCQAFLVHHRSHRLLVKLLKYLQQDYWLFNCIYHTRQCLYEPTENTCRYHIRAFRFHRTNNETIRVLWMSDWWNCVRSNAASSSGFTGYSLHSIWSHTSPPIAIGSTFSSIAFFVRSQQMWEDVYCLYYMMVYSVAWADTFQ